MSDLANITGTVSPMGGMVQQPDNRIARFEKVPTLNRQRSEQEGRPIFEPVVTVFVRQPGERDEHAVRAHEGHHAEFPRQWAAFQAGLAADPDGTPLSVLFPGDPHIVLQLRALHIFTVEMLAGVTEAGLSRIGMGAREYQARAQRFIEASEKAAPLQQAEAMVRKQQDEIEALKAQVQMLADAAARPRRKGEAE